MMKQAVKRFILFALLAIFVLLTVLLGIINGTNFTMAAEDADRITEMIAGQNGMLPASGARDPHDKQFRPGSFRYMGPSSPELAQTTRFFTVEFPADSENAKLVAYHISAVSESEAIAWADTLKAETTGWTNRSYRYRVYQSGNSVFVTVVDQSRELLPSYRILFISLIGEVIGLLVSFGVLAYTGKRLFEPLAEADRKQRRFILDAENALKVPLTVISANTELMERASGPSERTRSVHRQVEKMSALVKRLEYLSLFDSRTRSEVSLSRLAAATLEKNLERFRNKGITLTSRIEPDVTLTGNGESLSSMLHELMENAFRYALHTAHLSLLREKERIVLLVSNDTDLADGSYEQVFDRFSTLPNNPEGTGLGLAHVKQVVKEHDGRVYANVQNGTFLVRIDL